MAWLDVRAEPVVISLPGVEAGRYCSMMLVEGTGLNYGIPSTRSTGGQAGNYMIVGPSWQGPTPKVTVNGRTSFGSGPTFLCSLSLAFSESSGQLRKVE